MTAQYQLQEKTGTEKIFRFLPWLIIAAGAALRLYVYFQNRNLMVDELNVVRNIYERSWAGLLHPLDYQQFAPPLFLWLLKAVSLIAGFSEKAMRLYPLLASVAGLVLLYKILVHLGLHAFSLPALCIFAFSAFIVRYSTDVKQYLPDAMTALALIYIALITPLREGAARKFGLVWCIAGSIAILSSMTSVFVLLAVGAYYLLLIVREKSAKNLLPLGLVSLCWLAVFGLYYHFILRYQIGSDYLQNWHQSYFLNLHLGDVAVRAHTGSVLQGLLAIISGTEDNGVAQIICLLLLLTGIVHTARRAPGVLLLCLLPVLAMLVASCFHAFTLLPRVCIFSVPLCLILITYGLKVLAGLSPRWAFLPLAAITVFILISIKPVSLLANKLEVDELTTCVDFAQAHGVAIHDIYLQEYVAPSLTYYCNIHPDRAKYSAYKELRMIGTGAQLDSLKAALTAAPRRSAFIYYWIDDATLDEHRAKIFSALQPVDSLVKPGYRVMVFSARGM